MPPSPSPKPCQESNVIHIEETIKSERIYEGKILSLRKDTVTTVGGGVGTREIVEHPSGAVIAAVTDDGEMVMVEQFRKPIERTIWEAPAGKVDEGEDPLECARRELVEETGYHADSFEFLTAVYPSVGFMNEKLYIYLARGLHKGEAHPDWDEDLATELMDLDLLHERAMAGELDDAKTVIAILMAWEKLRMEK